MTFRDSSGVDTQVHGIGEFAGMCTVGHHPRVPYSRISITDLELACNDIDVHKTHLAVTTISGGKYIFDSQGAFFVLDPHSVDMPPEGTPCHARDGGENDTYALEGLVQGGIGYFPPHWTGKPTIQGIREIKYLVPNMPMVGYGNLSANDQEDRIGNFLSAKGSGDPRVRYNRWRMDRRTGGPYHQDGSPEWSYWIHMVYTSWNALNDLGPTGCDDMIRGEHHATGGQVRSKRKISDNILYAFSTMNREGWMAEKSASPSEIRSAVGKYAEAQQQYPHHTHMMNNMLGGVGGYRTSITVDDAEAARDGYGYTAKDREARDRAGMDAVKCMELSMQPEDHDMSDPITVMTILGQAYDEASGLWMEGRPTPECVTTSVMNARDALLGTHKDRTMVDKARLAIYAV
jgi:hypothetical protein